MDENFDKPFELEEEHGVVSLALQLPEFFSSVGSLVKVEHFQTAEARFIMEVVQDLASEAGGACPARSVVIGEAKRRIRSSDENLDAVETLLLRRLEPSEAPFLKARLKKWAKHQQFRLIYEEENIDAYRAGEYDKLVRVIEDAQKIDAAEYDLMFFFEELDAMFSAEANEKLTCGFKELDEFINSGGPGRKEVFVWMAPTNTGKTIVLSNCGVQCCAKGLRVLHVTCEADKHNIQRKYAQIISDLRHEVVKAAITSLDAIQSEDAKDAVIGVRKRIKDGILAHKKGYGEGDVVIAEAPAYSLSASRIEGMVEYLVRSRGWQPDVIIVDYMELIEANNPLGRSDATNKEYLRQQRVSTELRSLAQKTKTLVITATQGNRAAEKAMNDAKGDEDPILGMDKLADSFAKAMPVDYMVTINQTPEERKHKNTDLEKIGVFRFYIAKNRNGPKFEVVRAEVDYNTFIVRETRVAQHAANIDGRNLPGPIQRQMDAVEKKVAEHA